MGGYNYNDVWYSEDGITWHQATDNAGWSARRGHSSVVFDNKLWVIGGYDDNDNSFNDVWYSEDGTTWHQATNDAAWFGRNYHTSVVFDNKMWVMGGAYCDVGWIPCNDVWYSEDGSTWYQATDNAAWPVRAGHSSVVFNNAMWIMGGWTHNTDGCGVAYGYCNDVWYSEDGTTWHQATDNAGWYERGAHATVAFDNKLLVIAGETGNEEQCDNNVYGTGLCTDIWYSEDGTTWHQAASDTWPWVDGIGYHTAAVMNEQLYIMGGYLGYNWDESNSVWSTPNQSISHYQVCWDTAEGGCTNSAKVSPQGSVLAAATGTDSWLTKLGKQIGILPETTYAQVSQLSYTLPSLTPGTYHISVTAVDYQGQSTSSSQVLSHTVGLVDTGYKAYLPALIAITVITTAILTIRTRQRRYSIR